MKLSLFLFSCLLFSVGAVAQISEADEFAEIYVRDAAVLDDLEEDVLTEMDAELFYDSLYDFPVIEARGKGKEAAKRLVKKIGGKTYEAKPPFHSYRHTYQCHWWYDGIMRWHRMVCDDPIGCYCHENARENEQCQCGMYTLPLDAHVSGEFEVIKRPDSASGKNICVKVMDGSTPYSRLLCIDGHTDAWCQCKVGSFEGQVCDCMHGFNTDPL